MADVRELCAVITTCRALKLHLKVVVASILCHLLKALSMPPQMS